MNRVATTLLRKQMITRCSPMIQSLGVRSITNEIRSTDIPRPNRNVRRGPLNDTFSPRDMAEIYAREFKESSSSEEIVAIERAMSKELQKKRETDRHGKKAKGMDDPSNVLNMVYPIDLANYTKKKMGRAPDDDGRMTKDRRV